jgi:hypothetical protein
MHKQKFLSIAAITGCFVFASIFMSSCKKESSNPVSTEEDFSVSAQRVGDDESTSNDIDNMTAQVARHGTFSPGTCPTPDMDMFSLHSCAVVTNDSVNHVLTFDFGTGCTGRDGRVRSGRVIVNYSGTGYFDAGSSWVVTFDNFFVDGRHVEGSRSVTNNGINAAGNMNWTISATNMRITRPDGTYRTWNSQRTRELISGYGDSLWVNDIYRINGTSSGTNSNGESFSCSMTDLIRDHSCRWITGGVMVHSPANRPAVTIDFGNGTCDDLATVTRNGNSRTIHLH